MDRTENEVGVIVNPYSGRSPIKKAKSLIQGLRTANFDYQLHVLSKQGLDADTMAALSEVSKVIVIGGDGSVGTIVHAFLSENLDQMTFGTLPGGTGNEVARYLETTTKNTLIKALKSDHVLPLDLFSLKIHRFGGRREERYFVANILIGHFGLAIRSTPSFTKRLLGQPAYFIGILLAILRYKNFHSKIYCDGKCVYEGSNLAISVGNVATAAGGVPLTPEASPSDGEVDLLVAENLKRVETLHALPIVLRGEHLNSLPVRYFTGRRVSMHLRTPHVGVDGEYLGKTRKLEITHKTSVPFISNKIGSRGEGADEA